MLNKQDVTIIRELAARVAEIAALPVQEEKRELWRKLNACEPVRPMVMIDQVCWNEMNIDDELTLRCNDTECRRYEDYLRRTLFQWAHFPVDMVVEPFIRVPKAIQNSGFGIIVHEETAVTDPTNAVVAHRFENQFQTKDDLEKHLFSKALEKINADDYRGAKVVIKGCSNLPVPDSAYVELTYMLKSVVSSIMFGEPCSTVPVYKARSKSTSS